MNNIAIIVHQKGVQAFLKDKGEYQAVAAVESITSKVNEDYRVVINHTSAVYPEKPVTKVAEKGKKKAEKPAAPAKIVKVFCPIGVPAPKPRIEFRPCEHSRGSCAGATILLAKNLGCESIAIFGYEALTPGEQFNLRAVAMKNALWQLINLNSTPKDSDN